MKQNIKENKIFLIGTLALAIIFVLSVFLYSEKQNNVYAIADFQGNSLVGTTWQIDNVIGDDWTVEDGTITAEITYNSNNEEFEGIYIGDSGNDTFILCFSYNYNSPFFSNGEWGELGEYQAYRTITITGGADSNSTGENFSAIKDWLNDNAELISITPPDEPVAETGVFTDVIIPLTFVILTSAVLCAFVLQTKKQNKNISN